MYRALLIAIVVVISVLIGLTLVMVGARAVKALADLWWRRRRADLEPVVVRDIAVEGRAAEEVLQPRLRFGDRLLLRPLLLETVSVVRGVARDRISAALEGFGFVDEWIEGLRSPRWWKRADCAENLGIAGSPRSVDGLVRLMEDPVPEVRLRAAKALGAIRGSTAIRPLVEALDQPDRWSTIRIADVLAETGKEAVLEVIDAWESLSASARIAALDVLGQVRELSVTPFLRRQLAGADDADVRARAAHALGAIADPGARDALLEALADDHWPVRAMAAKALGRIGRRDAVEALAGALADRAWWVRANAAEALRGLGDDGLRALKATLDSDDPYARHQAVMMLQAAGEVDLVAGDLVADDPSRREEARSFLLRLAAVGHRELLRGIAEHHALPEVRRELRRLIRPGGGGGGMA